MTTCPEGGNWATKHFSDSSIAAIKSGLLKHHLDIDIWFTKSAMSLKITDLRLQGGDSFADGCSVAYLLN